MTPDELLAAIQHQNLAHYDAVGSLLREYLTNGSVVTVPAGGHLQAALDRPSGLIQLEAGATYESQGFVIRSSGTRIAGNAAWIRGSVRPALTVLPGVTDVQISNLFGASGADSVFQFGANDQSQTTIDAVPRRILVHQVVVPSHRRKRAFAVHAQEIQLQQCGCEDVWDDSPSHDDSQGLYIHNTPGKVTVVDSDFSAGSECVLVGGDTPRIAGLIPTGLFFQRCRFWRPLSWQAEKKTRKVKTIFELKTGREVRIENCILDGCWFDDSGQQGFAFTFTPRQGGAIEDVVIEQTTVRHCGGLVNILGENNAADQPSTPFKTSNIVFRLGSAVISKQQFGGYGCLALCERGVQALTFDRYVARHDGGKLIDIADKRPHGTLAVWDSFLTAGPYGIAIAGRPNLRPPSLWNPELPELGGVQALSIRGNTFADAAPELKRNAPDQRYVSLGEWLAIEEVGAALA